jgi:uncharacterized protein (TIGR01777 family)
MLSRNPALAKGRLSEGVPVFQWDPVTSSPPAAAFEGVDAVVNLVGESVLGLWTGAKKKRIHHSRVNATRNLIRGIESSGAKPRVLISASAVGYYGDRGEKVLTEDVSPSSDFLSNLCVEWENEARRAEALGIRVVCLRIGLVLGRGGGMMPALLPAARLGLFGSLGPGTQWWPWVHVDDVTGIAKFCIGGEVKGPVNVTAPQPVRQRDFAIALGHILRRRPLLKVPGFLLKLAGGLSREMLSSQRAVPHALLNAGYEFHHSDLESALRDLAG